MNLKKHILFLAVLFIMSCASGKQGSDLYKYVDNDYICFGDTQCEVVKLCNDREVNVKYIDSNKRIAEKCIEPSELKEL